MTVAAQVNPRHMRPFLIIWSGQLVSMLGSNLTNFAVGFWLLRETGSVTLFALSNVFILLPAALVSPFAGVIVDRNSRRTVMILADTAQALATLVVGLLFFFNALQVWHIYVAITASAIASAFQRPAWSASIPLLVPKNQLGRAAGMGRLSESIGRLAAPALAGILILTIDLAGIILIDFATFLIAVVTLLLVHIPDPPRHRDKTAARKNVLQDVAFGWRYLLNLRGLFILVIMLSLLNLFVNFAGTLTVPMALTIANEAVVGTMMSIAAGGMFVGSLVMSAWGGPRRRLPLLLAAIIVQGVAFFAAGLRPSIILITAAIFAVNLCFAFISSLTGPIFQTKIAPAVQGRVFATVAFLAMILEPLGQVVVGPITDNIFEPLMGEGGALALILGPVIGAGPGRGMAVVFMLMGGLIVLLGLFGFLYPRVYRLEHEIADAIRDESEMAQDSAPVLA